MGQYGGEVFGGQSSRLPEGVEALPEVRVVQDQADGGLVGEQAQGLAAAAVDAAGRVGLAGTALGGVAAGQLGQAAGVVEAAEIACRREQVDQADIAQARIWPRSQPSPVRSKAASMRRSRMSMARSAASARSAAN